MTRGGAAGADAGGTESVGGGGGPAIDLDREFQVYFKILFGLPHQMLALWRCRWSELSAGSILFR